MSRMKHRILFLFTLVTVLVLNVVIGYINSNSQDFISYGNKIIKKSNLITASEMLSQYDNDEYAKAIEKYKNAISENEEYINALEILSDERYRWENNRQRLDAEEIVGNRKITEEQIENLRQQYDYCIERLEYAVNYPDYIETIRSNAEDISGISIIDSKVQKSFLKAEGDFYGMEDVKISAAPDIDIMFLFSDSVTDILGIMAAVICAVLYTIRCRVASAGKTSVKSSILIYTVIFSSGIILVYLSNMAVTHFFVGIGDLSRSVQSVTEFYCCPYRISLSTLIAVRLVFKLLACLTVYFICIGIFNSQRKIKAVITGVLLVVVELILIITDSRLSLKSLLESENIVGKYDNMFIFGEAVNTTAIVVIFTLIIFLISVVYGKKSINEILIFAKEQAEKIYYDEINNKYNEARLIRHDMKNHLTAVAMLMDEGNFNEARKYLDDISIEMDNGQLPVKTGSAVLDGLLFKKLSEIKEKGIVVDIKFETEFSGVTISEYDLCSIFGNILDNAYEAVVKLKENDRKISLTVKRQMDMIFIHCQNKCEEINEDFSTTKADKAYHGMGLGRIRRISEKYGGTTEIEYNEGMFDISVILN